MILVKSKGNDRDNTNSKQNLCLGRKWAELAGRQYRYFMVFDENDTELDGAYILADFIRLLRGQ